MYSYNDHCIAEKFISFGLEKKQISKLSCEAQMISLKQRNNTLFDLFRFFHETEKRKTFFDDFSHILDIG